MSKGSNPRTYNKKNSDNYRENKFWDKPKDNKKEKGKL